MDLNQQPYQMKSALSLVPSARIHTSRYFDWCVRKQKLRPGPSILFSTQPWTYVCMVFLFTEFCDVPTITDSALLRISHCWKLVCDLVSMLIRRKFFQISTEDNTIGGKIEQWISYCYFHLFQVNLTTPNARKLAWTKWISLIKWNEKSSTNIGKNVSSYYPCILQSWYYEIVLLNVE